MKKRILCICVCVISIIILGVVISVKEACKKLQLNESVQRVLDLKGFSDCILVKYGKLSEVKEENIVLEITEKEIEEYIYLELEDNAYRKMIYDRNIVADNDLAIVDYKIIDGTNEIKRIVDAPIRVGSGYYDTYLESIVLGREVGKEYVVDWKVSDNITDSELAGKELKIWFVVKELHEVIVPTLEEYVSQSEFSNSNKYVEYVKKTLMDNKRREMINRATELVIDQIVDDSKFKIDNERVVENAIQYYYRYEQWADIYEISVEEFIEHATNENVYENCYRQSLREIQRYMVIGRYAYLKEIEVSSKDIIEYCEKKEINVEEISEDDLVHVKYEVLEKKVLEQICRDYVKIETDY